MSSEFDLIQTYFNWQQDSPSVKKGIGDDAAVVEVPDNKQLVVTTDTLISGVHFPEQTPAHAIGYKSLAVNLSDLAAMGATPAWFTLAISLPEYNDQWLAEFSEGLKQLAIDTGIVLIGGDTTKGSLSISISAMGLVNQESLLLRSSAKHGDAIYVTGTLGDAAAGLVMLNDAITRADESCINKLNYPQPRNHEIQLICKYVNACLDISDGFLADLSHILKASTVGAIINLNSIPLSLSLKKMDREKAMRYALTGGDDYELLFTVSADNQLKFNETLKNHNLKCDHIGVIDQSVTGIISTESEIIPVTGYNHFA